MPSSYVLVSRALLICGALSYGDAEDHGDSFLSMPSTDPINRRSGEYGSKLTKFLPECIGRTTSDAVLAEGRKHHSQVEDRPFQNGQGTLGDTGHGSTTLLGGSVNDGWTEFATATSEFATGTDDATIVGDAQTNLVNGFTDQCRENTCDRVQSGTDAQLQSLGRRRR